MRTRALSRFVALSLALASAAVLNSCVGDGTTLDPSGQPLPPPRITVTPDTLAVSVVEETTQWYEITITNDGGLPLRVTGVRSTEEFLGTDFDDPVEIAGGDTLAVAISVEGAGEPGTIAGSIEITSNDEIDPTVNVTVEIEITPAPEPEIDVIPIGIDADLTEGEAGEWAITISNLGSADLVVSDISSQASFLFPQVMSTTIAPAESERIPVNVTAVALSPGFHQGWIDVTSNDEDEPLVSVPVTLVVDSTLPFPPTLSAIQANVFTPKCALSFCHGVSMQAALTLEEGLSYASLVSVASVEVPAFLRVQPGDPDVSYLIKKLVAEDPDRSGLRMPLVGDFLTDEEVHQIRRWIARGAANN